LKAILKKIEHLLFLSTSKATVEFDADCFQFRVHTRQSGIFNQIDFQRSTQIEQCDFIIISDSVKAPNLSMQWQ